MIITVTLDGVIICAILFAWAQVMKFIAGKFNLAFLTKYLPLLVLALSMLIYGIALKSFLNGLVNAAATTAVCCYTYDLYKAIKEMIQNIISRIRTRLKNKE